ELVSYWRKYMNEARSFAPVKVKSGPLMENVSSGKNVNIDTIPTPRWHEHDGGYYIGTGCMVIMKDPDTGWINYGAYRVQYQGPTTGLPSPAHAEIAFEGFIHPNDLLDGGPLGEWTGYYAGGRKKEPAIRIATFMHRNNPILLGAVPAVPPDDDSFYRGTYRS